VAVHLYGVTRADATLPTGLQGRQDAAIRLIRGDSLAVMASDVDPGAAAGRKDLLLHAHVLEACAEELTVVPMQFGMALADDEAVREQVLVGQRERLEYLLASLDGLVQVTVQASHEEEPALREVLRRSPDLLAARERLRTTPGGGSAAAKMELGEAVAAALQELGAEDGDHILDQLAPLTRAVSESEAKGTHGILHAALLVERAQRPALDAMVARVREELADRVRIRYVGPQPAYSFLEPLQTGELAWA
jgi:hypothetical protein